MVYSVDKSSCTLIVVTCEYNFQRVDRGERKGKGGGEEMKDC